MKKYRRDGTPYPEGERGLLEWGKDMQGDRAVRQETLPNGRWVSTVWIGLDHGFGVGEPQIFETMVFPKKGEYGELDMERYATEKDALEGHIKMVNKWSK